MWPTTNSANERLMSRNASGFALIHVANEL